ncbi:AraC family transcriptional regulator [Nocardioides sp. NPDC059952]|uniref:AraC family transcriptional regulator n=1 Tax=Nocardioides sp. NPDC059952 TaxID=3347014 RepID=UPI00366A43A4
MSSLDLLMDGPRAQAAFLLKAVFAGEWSITAEDEVPLTVIAIARGAAVFTGCEGPQKVAAGDVIVCRGPATYVIADSADRPADIRILPGQVCVDPNGALLAEELALGVRTWGNSRSPEATVMLIGTYERETSVGSLLLSRLPTSVVLRGFDTAVLDLLAAELVREEAGQAALLDRLLDVLVVKAVREVLAASPALPADDAVAAVLRAMEQHPQLPWTVAGLGEQVGLSRAALARRFTEQVGEPPLAYLTRWRLALAADLLVGTDLTLSAIAARVGYANPFALSAAFKRLHGTSPTSFRSRHVA